MPTKIRIYNNTYSEIFPIPEGKEQELIARAKKYKMNYEIISSNPAQENNTPQAVPTKPMAQQSNNKAANNSNQVDFSEIDADTRLPIPNYMDSGIRLPMPKRKDSGTRLPIPTMSQSIQARDQKKDELVKQQWRKEEDKRKAENKRKSPMDLYKEEQVTENIKLATSPTYDAFGRDIATEEQLKAKEQLNKNQGVILSNSFLRPDKNGKIPSNTENTYRGEGGTKQRVEMPQMEVDAEGNIKPYGWGEDNTETNNKILQQREYQKQVEQDRKQELYSNLQDKQELVITSNNDKERQSIRYRMLTDVNNIASTELQGLDALTNQGKLSPYARNYLSHQISRTARKMQENGLNTFDAINRDNVEGLITLGWMSVVRNGLNAHFLNSLGDASPEDKDSYMQAMDLISYADNSTSTSNVGYDMLNAVMQSLPYMGEFMLTGGISAIGKEATKSVTKNVAKGLIKEGVKKKASIKVGQYLGTNAPKLMAFSVASPFAYQHAQEKAIERVGKDFKLEDIKVSDILEGYVKNAIEFTVEGSGDLMKLGIGKIVGNGRVGSFFSYLKNKTPEKIREIYKATKFDGVGYEFSEEFLQNIVDTMVWDEMTWKEVFDPYNNFITLATCAIIQSPATVAQSGSYVKDKYKIHQDLGVVAADDRGVARELKRAMSMSDQSKRYEAVLNSGISNLKSVKAQKSAIAYVFRSEKMQFQKQVIDEERINTARREVIPIVTGLSYNNSIATVESNEGDKYFIVGETNQDTRLVPVRKIVTEKDANGNEFYSIEGIKRLVDFDKLDASTYSSTPYDEYVNRLVDSKLGKTRLQEQQQEIKAEELGMAVEQQAEAATMQDFQAIQEVQAQSEELGIEDKELREGSVVTIIGDSNEGNKRNFNVINTDGINAVIEDNESGLQHTLPLSVLNVEYQLTDKNEKEIKAVENAINGVEPAPEEETLQVNTELQTPPIQEETIQEQQQDIYADFARDKNGEIDINNLSAEQQLTYAENEVGKDFAVNQATQVKNNLLKQIDRLNKKMPSMSLAKAVQVRKDIAKLEEEVGIYDIYINENSESPQKEEENLDLENKTYSERLSFLEEFAQIDPRAYVLYGIAAGEIKFIWGGERGIAAELGFKRKNNQGEKKGAAGELRARISILSNKGYTPDTLGEELGEEFHNIDSLQGRDIVIEALSEVNSKKDALLALESSYIKFNPEKDVNYIAQLEQEEKAVQEAAAYENNIINAYWKYELQNLDERTKQIGIFAETIGVPSDLIEETQSTYDLITLIEEYNGQNNNTTGNNGSNGVSRSEGTQTTGVEQGIREGEFDGRSESGNSNSYQSSEENGLSDIQDEQTRNEVSYDTDKRGNDSEGYGKEQSENANQTLGEQRPQEIRDVSGSSNEEGNNVKEESNLPNGDDAIRSEEVYKGGISNTETGEPATSTIEDTSQGDSQVGRPSLENQVQSIINKFIEDNNFKFKDVRLISKDSDEYRKTAGNKNVTGWYLSRTKEVIIVYDNLGKDIKNEVKKTYLHEILGHKTIREALRKEDYVPLMQLIYDAIPAFYKAEISKNQGKDIRNTVELELSEKGVTDKATIEQEYQKRLDEIVANRIEREQAEYKDKIEYADEFLAVFTENYDNLTPESKKTLIDIIKDFFKRVFGIDADNNFFEDLVKLSYEIAWGEKTAQGKIDKLSSMLNIPAVAELSKEKTKTELHNLDPTTNLDSLEKNIAKILEDYRGREMAAIQVEGYMNEFSEISKEYLAKYNLNTREELQDHLAKLQTKLREGKGKERMQAKEQARVNKMINEISEMTATAQAEMEREIEDFGEEIGDANKDTKDVAEKSNNVEVSANTIVSEDRKNEILAKLKDKAKNLNAGLDPESALLGMELTVYYVERGVRTFAAYVKAISQDLNEAKYNKYLKSFYNLVRDNPDYADIASQMDSYPIVIGADVEEILKEENVKVTPQSKAEKLTSLIAPNKDTAEEKQIKELKENKKKPLKNTNDDVSLQGNLFDEQILETLKPNENEQQHSNNGQRVLQGNSNRLSNHSQENLEQGGNRGDSRHESGSVRETNDGIDKSNDGQGSILPTDVRVLNEEPAPALVEVQVSSNDDKSFNKNQKYKDNISALEVLLSLIKENRKATAQEKETLLKYVGFGGLKEVLLDPEKNKWNDSDLKYKDSVLRIIELANEFDNVTGNKGTLEAIKGSTLNAHFTSDTLINAIYKGISHLGFNGGTILEPSSGIGNFITYMPSKLKRKSKISAIELDPLTGNILKYIHDDVNVKISGYENANISENSFDLVISNVPFGNYKVFDPTFKGDKTKFTNKIHGYFFAKAIDSVRDGGIIAFVTSTGVMDSNSNKELREYIASKANFIGAVRLPNTAFKNVANTRVVTDVIFLQKGKHKDTINQNELFINSSTMEVEHKDGEVENVTVSDYFQNFPNFVLGTMVAGGLYSRNDYSVEDNGSYKKINDIITKILPKNIYANTESGIGLHVNDKEVEISDFKEGNIAVKEGKIYKKEDGKVTEISINEPAKKIKDYIELRTTLIELIYAEYIGESTNDLQVRRDKLNSLYDRFVKDYGHLNKSIVKIAKHDADGYCVAALENKDKSKADIFTKQTINPIRRNQRAETVEDAMVVSLYENASIDIERIAELLGKSVQETIELGKGKIFEDPTGGFVSRDEYLSGNVKKKYKEAKQAVEEGKKEFEYNMTELEAIIPNDIPAVQIEAKLGSRWIPDSVYTDFARELLQDDLIEIKYINATDEYVSIGSNPINALAINKYGTSRVNAMKIIIGALHINPPKVYKEIYENGATKRVTDEKETAKVKEKYEEVRDIFEDWVYKDTSRRDLLAKIYNEKYNTNVKRKYDGSKLYIAGINGIELRQHQKDAVWMLLQNNGGVIDHLVGAGKTFVMIVASMEMRRTNVAKKPMIMALKSTIPQIVESYRSAYPLAKILAPTEKDFKKENRLALFAKIANNEFDCIIMSHENYGKIPHEREIQEKLLNDELDALIREYSLLRDSGNGKDSKRAEQGLITRINNQKVKIEKLLSSPKDNTITFEQMGIDHIMVDESQQFKNLSYTTKMYGVAGLGVATGSKRAFNLLVGIRYLQEMYKGDKGTTFLSGTPISNSMVEMYSLLNYLRPNKLKELNINTFDSWATTFANPTTDIEFTVTGDFKQKTRIREFINVPELSTMYTEIADIRTDDNLILDKPKMKGGGYSVIPITMSRDQEDFANNLILMAKNKDGKYIGRGLSDSDKKAIMLIVTNLSSKMAIDMRLIDGNYDYDRNGKIAKLVENVAKTFNETTPFLGTQLIFSDIGTPKITSNKVALLKDYMEDELGINIDTINSVFGETTSDNYKLPQMSSVRSRMIETLELTDVEFEDILSKATESAGQFNVYSEIKERLIEAGVPADQIVFIHDYPSQKSKDKLFKDVNEGKVRIVLGSTQKLGTGVNVQERIVAVHHLDVPWTPASMEQRNGRALRQGNKVAKKYMNNELPVYAYATERTLDTYKYQLLQTKQRFLTQVKSGDVEDRVISEGRDDGDSGVGYAELVAMLSGNQDILLKSKLEEKAKKLQRAKRNFEGEFDDAQSNIEKLTEKSKQVKDNLEKTKIAYKGFPLKLDSEGKLLVENINGYKIKGEKDKEPTRIDYAKKAVDIIEKNFKSAKIGDVFDITLGDYHLKYWMEYEGRDLLSQKLVRRMSLVSNNELSFTFTYVATPGVLLNNIQKKIEKDIPNLISSQETLLQKTIKDIELYKNIINKGRDWEKIEELNDTKQELKDVTERLKNSGDLEEEKPQEGEEYQSFIDVEGTLVKEENLEKDDDARFRENKQFQDEQRNTQKISNKTYANFNLNEEIRFRIGNKARANYDDILKAKRPDLSKECINTFLEYLDGIDDKKKEKVTFNWFAKGTIIVPEDMYKVEQAIKVADIKKIDPMQFNSPMEIIDKFSDVKIKGDRINPDNVKTLSNKVDYGHGITVYNVSESEQGREDMREIINTHSGEKSSPWCLLQGNENGELTSQSKNYWKHYNKITKRVAFLNGKLLAFSANNNSDIIWWDKTDNSHEGIPITQRIPNDELKRTGTILFNEETKQLGKPFDLFKGDKINGLYEEWRDNGQLAQRINYKEGKRDGLRETWYKNGVLMERINYKNGELHGLHERWSKEGQLRERGNYKDGDMNGLYEKWNNEGQLLERSNYKGWRQDGLHEEWYDNGQPKERSNYKYGRRDGLYEWWDKGGQLSERVNYKDEKKEGLYEEWYENGQLSERVNYKDGEKDGLFEEWYANGQPKERINYKKGMLNGLYEKFDINGKLTHSVTWSNDVLIKDNLNEDDVRFRENKQFQSEQSSIQKIGGKEYPHIDDTEIDDIRFRLGKKSRANYEDILIKKRKDLTEEGRSTFLDYLDTIDDKKKEKITFKWFAQGSVILPEDMPKIEQAIKVAEVKKIDPMQYDSPMKLIEEHADVELKDEKINPDNVRTLSNKVDYGNGITVYDVEESEQGREDMRNIINTHFGKNRSPWCLLQGDEEGVLTSQSKKYWEHYNKITKRVAFLNGKLLAFSANSNRDIIWWDKTDKSHKGIPITQRIPDDELKRTGTMMFDEETKQLGKPYNLFKGDKINGVYEEWYENGQLWKRINYKDGVEDGLYENWDGNGQLWRRINFKDGKKDGLYEEWQQNGLLVYRINFKDGKKEGLHEEWYDNGQLSERVNYKDRDKDGLSERWYKNGQLWDRIDYKDGKLNGLYETRYDNGQLKERSNYKDWKKDGLSERWYDNGLLEERSNYKDGERNGLNEEFYRNGQLKKRSNYKDGKRYGLYEEGYYNGQLRERGNYKDWKKDGLHEMWYDNGELMHSVIYSNGAIIKDNQNEDDVRFRNNNPIQSKIDRFNELLNGESNNRYRTINIDGKERPTINSLGKPIASTEEGLRNFWKWFGDSKVVDSEGLPLVVWRGENADDEEYIKGDISFYTDNKYSAIGYGDGQAFAEYLSFKNPLNIMNLDDKKYVESVLREFQDSEYNVKEVDSVKIYDKGINVFLNRIIKSQFNEFMDFAKSKGYDSVISFDSDVSGQNRIAQYISSSPNQIKSINNVGTFDPENEDIRFRDNLSSRQSKIERFNALLNEEYEDEKEKKKKTFEDRKNEIEIAYFNKFKPLKDIHEKLTEDGFYIPFNVYQRTVSADSRINAKIEKLDETLGKDLKESIAKVQKKGFSYDEIGIYFQAQFMPERTAQLIQKRIEKDFVLNRIDGVIKDLESKKDKNFMDLVMPAEEIKKANDKIDKSISKLNKVKEERAEKIRSKLQERGLAGEQGLKELMESKGFPDVTPEDYIKMFEKEVGEPELINELNRNKKAIVKFTLDTAYVTGQVSKEQYAEYTSSENYVPLRGWDMTFDDSGEDNIFQSVSKAAKGRKSLAANPINYLYAMAYTAVTFGEKNILKNNLATLVLMNRSNPNFMDNFGYNTLYSGDLVDEEGNEVPFEVSNEDEFNALEGVIKETLVIRMNKEKFDNLNSQKNPHKYDEEYKKHILTFYDNGIRHELYIEDINLVNAFKSDKMTRTQANMKRATSYVTKFMTSRNISFIPANLIRDIQTTMFLNKYFDNPTKDAAFKAQIIKNMGKVGTSVLKGVWKNDWNTDKEIGKIYNEWLLGGGRTGWLQSFKDVADIEKKVKRDIANTNKVSEWLSNRYHFKATEACAEFSENLVRFSVYYTAIQNGFTKEQSIWFSNDASLNFNLKGAKGNWLRAIYGFWNASLAGFYKVGKFTWENKGKAAATFTFFMAAGFGKWWLDQLDDDDEKRSEYKKQRMFELFGVGIPMSYDLLPPYRIGYMLADVIFGDMTNTKFGYETAMSFTEIMPEQVQTALSFIAKYNPKRDKIEWANLEELAGLSPTSLKPLVEVFITNKNFMGQDIKPENKFKDLPDSAKYKEEQVTALDKLVANMINGLYGFDWKDYDEESKFTSTGRKRPSVFDVSPAVIHHLVSSYFSGTAQLITGSSDAITMATDDKEDGFNKISGKIPVINRFYIPTNESLPLYKKMEQMQAKYSDLLENHKEITRVLNDKKSTQEEKAAYRKRLQVLKKNPLYNEAIRYKRREDDIRDLRKQLRLANKLGKYEQANELKMKLDKIDREINNK